MRSDRMFSFTTVSPRFITCYDPVEYVVFKPIQIHKRNIPYMQDDQNKKQRHV